MRKKIRTYFIPRHDNDHKPYFLRKKGLTIIVLFVFLVQLGFLAYPAFLRQGFQYLASVLPSVLVTLTNEHRAQSKLDSLSVNPVLVQAAQMKANDMAAKGYFSHVSPDGKEPWYWLNQAGYEYTYAGENLAVNFIDSSDVTDAWMQSPTHRANIVHDRYTEIGIAVASGVYKGKNTMFVVQFFGTPKVAVAKPVQKPVEQKVAQVPTPVTQKTAQTPQSVVQTTPQSPQVPERVLGESESPSNVLKPIEQATQRVATNPRALANTIFAVVILLVTAALSLAIFIAIHIQHPAMIAGSVAVIVLIAGMVYFNEFVVSTGVELPTDIVAATISGL